MTNETKRKRGRPSILDNENALYDALIAIRDTPDHENYTVSKYLIKKLLKNGYLTEGTPIPTKAHPRKRYVSTSKADALMNKIGLGRA